jgi:hypothetical protein
VTACSIDGLRHRNTWIAVEAATRHQSETHCDSRLYRKVFLSHGMMQPEDAPQHEARILDRPILFGEVGYAATSVGMVHELARGAALLRVMRGHPQVVRDEVGAAPGRTVG